MKDCSLYVKDPSTGNGVYGPMDEKDLCTPAGSYLCKKCHIPGHFMEDCSLYVKDPSTGNGVYGQMDSGGVGGQMVLLGDWMCGQCGEHNFARRRECFGCGAGRGAGSDKMEKSKMESKMSWSPPPPSPSDCSPGDGADTVAHFNSTATWKDNKDADNVGETSTGTLSSMTKLSPPSTHFAARMDIAPMPSPPSPRHGPIRDRSVSPPASRQPRAREYEVGDSEIRVKLKKRKVEKRVTKFQERSKLFGSYGSDSD